MNSYLLRLLAAPSALLAALGRRRQHDSVQALESTERFYHEIIDSLPLLVYSVEGRAPYRPLYVSRGHKMLGYTRDEWMLADPPLWLRVLHPEDREWVLRATARAMERREALEYEYRVIDRSGRVRWLHDRGAFVTGSDGSTVMWQGVMMDVTERRNAQEAMQETEKRYHQIFENSVSANFVATVDGKLLACNLAFARLLGLSTIEEVLGMNANSFYSDPAKRERWIERVRAEGTIELFEDELRRPDGHVVHLLQNVHGVFDHAGALREVHGHIVDVTERRQLEEQLRRSQNMEALGRLAGGIAHDFNNLLSVIGNYAAILHQDAPTGSEQEADLLEITNAVKRGASLTSQLLTFGRRGLTETFTSDVDSVIRESERVLRRLLGPEVGLELDLDAAGMQVAMDRGKIDQVLVNLLINAADSCSEQPGGRIVVSTEVLVLSPDSVTAFDVPAGRYLSMVVRDTGRGMDEETARRAIDPFFTTKAVGRGTGLGLWTVYGLVKQAGGALTITSKPGSGTAIAIVLPMQAPTPSSGAGDGACDVVPHTPSRRTILLVDDEDGVRMSVGRMLRSHGYVVHAAASGPEALELFQTHGGAFDIVVTDIRMPGMTGIELVHKLRELAPNLPALAMSGYQDESVMLPNTPDGSVLFLAKPFSMETLLARVRTLAVRTHTVSIAR